MTEVEQISYKICYLRLENNLESSCRLKLVHSVSSECNWTDGVAVITLRETLQQCCHPNQFCIELKLEGRLWVNGVKSIADKKEIHAIGQQKLIEYANTILSMLAENSGLEGLDIEGSPLRAEDIHFGQQPDAVKNGRVVKLCPNGGGRN